MKALCDLLYICLIPAFNPDFAFNNSLFSDLQRHNMKIILIGAAGRLGSRLTTALGTRHELVLADLIEIKDPRFIQTDITDIAQVRKAVEGCDAVINTAIFNWPPCGKAENLAFGAKSWQVHVVGLYNILWVAWERGLKRVVHTSSISAVDGLPQGTRVTSDTRHYSNGLYGLGKGVGEDICRMFKHRYDLSCAILRLGSIFMPEAKGAWVGDVFTPDLALLKTPHPLAAFVHVDDVVRAVESALTAPDPGDAIVPIVGAGLDKYWDLESAKKLYGWEPHYAFSKDGLPCRFEGTT